MSTRSPFVGGNWKMNTDLASAVELAEGVVADCGAIAEHVDVAIYPPYPYLQAVGRALGHHPVSLGAQDLWPGPNGASTGNVSASMLVDLNVRGVIVGHSERRQLCRESNALVNRKLRGALDAGLVAVLCVGESLKQREAGEAPVVVARQVTAAFRGLRVPDPRRLVVAYEPIWAIGTGRTASPDDAQAMHKTIRGVVADRYDAELARSVRIVYGGSVNARNAPELFRRPDIDGGLVGGASLRSDEFASICRAAMARVGAA